MLNLFILLRLTILQICISSEKDMLLLAPAYDPRSTFLSCVAMAGVFCVASLMWSLKIGQGDREIRVKRRACLQMLAVCVVAVIASMVGHFYGYSTADRPLLSLSVAWVVELSALIAIAWVAARYVITRVRRQDGL